MYNLVFSGKYLLESDKYKAYASPYTGNAKWNRHKLISREIATFTSDICDEDKWLKNTLNRWFIYLFLTVMEAANLRSRHLWIFCLKRIYFLAHRQWSSPFVSLVTRKERCVLGGLCQGTKSNHKVSIPMTLNNPNIQQVL